jgi:phosphatidylglycerophosphatase A
MSEMRKPTVTFLLSSPTVFLALGCGAGLVPKAPGTAGSLLAIPVALALQMLPFGWQIAIWAAMCIAGVWLCDRAGKALGDPDHGAIVWDEICGQTMVLLLAPSGIAWIAAAFVAFRLFDIVKPWPIRIIDRRMPNGFGAMADDLMAGVCAIALVLGIEWVANATGA